MWRTFDEQIISPCNQNCAPRASNECHQPVLINLVTNVAAWVELYPWLISLQRSTTSKRKLINSLPTLPFGLHCLSSSASSERVGPREKSSDSCVFRLVVFTELTIIRPGVTQDLAMYYMSVTVTPSAVGRERLCHYINGRSLQNYSKMEISVL